VVERKGPSVSLPCGFNCRGSSGPKDKSTSISFTHVPSGQTVHFAAYLLDFSDNFNVRWNAETIYGRMDPISIYQGTGRTISLSWKVLSQGEEDGTCNMKNSSLFLNFQYPSFFGESADLIQNPPLLRLRFANLAMSAGRRGSLVGYVDGQVSFTPNLDAGFIYVGENIIPKEIDFSCNFVVLHDEALGWEGKKPQSKTFPYGFNTQNRRDVPVPGQTEGNNQGGIRDQKAVGPEPDLMEEARIDGARIIKDAEAVERRAREAKEGQAGAKDRLTR
jgi:hypothetical protein